MARRARPGIRKARGAAGKAAVSVATGASWIALVAATTLGLGKVGRVRAEISGERLAAEEGDSFRLIVQSYSPEAVGTDHLPAEHARPLGSLQQAITAEELRRGIAVDVVQVGDEAEPIEVAPIVVAWVERGQPDLDFDGLEARPRADAFYGVARSPLAEPASEQRARVVLTRHRV